MCLAVCVLLCDQYVLLYLEHILVYNDNVKCEVFSSSRDTCEKEETEAATLSELSHHFFAILDNVFFHLSIFIRFFVSLRLPWWS